MRERPKRSSKFGGVAKDYAEAALPEGLWAEDSGGDRSARGSWRPRKGMLHADVGEVFTSPVTTILGFELPGGDSALLIGEGTNAHGLTNVAEQTYVDAVGGGGFGETEFGEDLGE